MALTLFYQQQIVVDGASAYWPLDDAVGTSARDLAGSAGGTISGGVTLFQPGVLAPCMTFDGTTGKVVTAANVTMPLVCTMEFWCKRGTANDGVLLSSRVTGSTGNSIYFGISSGSLMIFSTAVSTGALAFGLDGAWHHGVIVLTGSTATFYSDGVQDGVPSSQVRTVPSTGAFGIGWDDPNNSYFHGAFQDVAIYPRALAPAEIAAHYALRLDPTAGKQKAYLQARSGIARSGAIRSNYVFPLPGYILVGGVDLTAAIQYGTLRVSLAINEEPDTASFDVMITTPAVQAAIVVGAEVSIGLVGDTERLFGGRILTLQTRRGPARSPSVCSVMCADYLQVVDSEYLITYDWPAQSTTATIFDLIDRCENKLGGVVISPAAVRPDLPNHAAFGVINERFSTVLRRLVTTFPGGGGFYIDPVKILHVWQGASEPGETAPTVLTLDNPLLLQFAETVDGAQMRDAVLVEGLRTTAPIGSPGPTDPTGTLVDSIPVVDSSIGDKMTEGDREYRIGTQRLIFARASGAWSAPSIASQTTKVTAYVPFDPGNSWDLVPIPVESADLVLARPTPWVLINEQYLRIINYQFVAGSWHIYAPRTGWGSPTGAIEMDSVVTAIDSLGLGRTTGRYDAPALAERVRPQPKESDVVMTVRSSTAPGVREHLVQDGRYSRTGASNRAAAELAAFTPPIRSIQWETYDLNTRPGRLQAYTFTEPPLAPTTGSLMVMSVELMWPVWGEPPRRSCVGADVSPASIVDAWVVDQR